MSKRKIALPVARPVTANDDEEVEPLPGHTYCSACRQQVANARWSHHVNACNVPVRQPSSAYQQPQEQTPRGGQHTDATREDQDEHLRRHKAPRREDDATDDADGAAFGATDDADGTADGAAFGAAADSSEAPPRRSRPPSRMVLPEWQQVDADVLQQRRMDAVLAALQQRATQAGGIGPRRRDLQFFKLAVQNRLSGKAAAEAFHDEHKVCRDARSKSLTA